MKTYKKLHESKEVANKHIAKIKERGGNVKQSVQNGKILLEYSFADENVKNGITPKLKNTNMNTYSEYKEVKSKQDAIVDMLSDKLNSYPKGAFGMTEESVRMSDEYKALKLQYAKEFRKIQDINSFGMKNFKKEIYKEHEEKRKQRRTE